MEETSHGNSNKKIFEDLGDQGKNFVEESEEFAGEDVVVTFSVRGGDDSINGKAFQEKFKGGQDWEYVKYKIGGILEVDPELIILSHNDTPIIPLYSICDIELTDKDVIMIDFKKE